MTTGADTTACPAPTASVSRLWRTAAVFGPGLLVMLADTDVGSVITAGQSGVQWGYRLLLLQVVLVPVLFVVQELTVRLALVTGRGHGELIQDHFGRFWAIVSVSGLAVACAGALLTEFSGVAGVGEIYGIPRAVSLSLAAAALLAVVLTGSYRRVESIAIAVGLFEFAFFFVAYYAHPSVVEVGRQMIDIPFANKDYLYLAAANIGAVIMPWMIFYQQSALADKRLGPEHLTISRIDTALGALVTQLVMAAVLVACAATIGHARPDATLSTVGEMSQALTPFLGETVGRVVFSLGVLGAGMVAAIVVSLALAWGVGEVTGYSRSLEMHPLRARWFYGVYCLAIIAGAVLVCAWPDLVAMNIAVQVMNALLLPLVIGFLIALAIKALPEPYRLKGVYLWFVIAIATATTALGVFGGLQGAGLL
ncbi:MAG: divalent metal cation transporter [Ancalomicrobiaceae bacterium]|nr:divalent metal cation transporter [Ancalomicrobiaceae bacterium]